MNAPTQARTFEQKRRTPGRAAHSPNSKNGLHRHEAFEAVIHSTFDIHAMLAFVGARDGVRARRLELALAHGQSKPARHGETTRRLGLPACRALMAYGRGDTALAITLLASLPTLAHRLGGSHAQRDVLHLTLLHAIERMRRPRRGSRAASTPSLEMKS
jgi:hypothetical protein